MDNAALQPYSILIRNELDVHKKNLVFSHFKSCILRLVSNQASNFSIFPFSLIKDGNKKFLKYIICRSKIQGLPHYLARSLAINFCLVTGRRRWEQREPI